MNDPACTSLSPGAPTRKAAVFPPRMPTGTVIHPNRGPRAPLACPWALNCRGPPPPTPWLPSGSLTSGQARGPPLPHPSSGPQPTGLWRGQWDSSNGLGTSTPCVFWHFSSKAASYRRLQTAHPVSTGRDPSDLPTPTPSTHVAKGKLSSGDSPGQLKRHAAVTQSLLPSPSPTCTSAVTCQAQPCPGEDTGPLLSLKPPAGSVLPRACSAHPLNSPSVRLSLLRH